MFSFFIRLLKFLHVVDRPTNHWKLRDYFTLHLFWFAGSAMPSCLTLAKWRCQSDNAVYRRPYFTLTDVWKQALQFCHEADFWPFVIIISRINIKSSCKQTSHTHNIISVDVWFKTWIYVQKIPITRVSPIWSYMTSIIIQTSEHDEQNGMSRTRLFDISPFQVVHSTWDC